MRTMNEKSGWVGPKGQENTGPSPALSAVKSLQANPTLNLEGGERQGLKGPLNYLTPALHRELCGQPEYTARGLLSTSILFSGHEPRGDTLSPRLWRGQYFIQQFRMTVG